MRERREQLDLTRAQLAHKVGCAVITLRKIETGERRPSRQLNELLQRHLQLAMEPQPTPPAPSLSQSRNDNAIALIGRASDIAGATARLLDPAVRALTLIGPGGVGKTSLARVVVAQVQTAFADGAALIELAPIADARRVPDAVLQSLGLEVDGNVAAAEAVITALRAQNRLLLLDNFEHVTDAATWVAHLLASCPQVTVLITSRHALGAALPVEVLYPVPPLMLPQATLLASVEGASAAQLFVQRAQAVDPTFQLNEKNAAAVAEICQRLDGLPLAIELVAARARLMSPQALLARLVDASGRTQLDRVADAGHAQSPRHKRLRDTLDWSYGLLNEQERRAFRQLSAFKGGWTLEAAEAVCDLVPEADDRAAELVSCWDALASLLDKSLIQQQRIEGEEEPRFTLLETVREYSREKLSEAGEALPTLRRHVRYLCEWAEAVEPLLVESRHQPQWLDRLEREHDNVRAALQWSLHVPEPDEGHALPEAALFGVRLAAALARFWWIRTHWTDGRAWLTHALDRLPAETVDANEFAATQPELARVQSRVLRGVGLLAYAQTDLQLAEHYYAWSLRLARPLGDKIWTSIVLDNLGTVAMTQGDFARAKVLTEEGLALDREMNNLRGVAFSLGTLGELAFTQGDYELAEGYWAEAVEMYRARGDENSVALTLVNLGATVIHLDRNADAMAYNLEGLALGQKLGNRHIEAVAHQNLADLTLQTGDREQSREHYLAALRMAGELQSASICCALLSAIGTQAAEAGHWARGATLYGAAAHLRASSGSVMHADERDLREKMIPQMRQQLGDAGYEAAYAAGLVMSLEAAIAYAAAL